MSSSVHYRPDIDGLRAVAVMLVVIFHAFPEAISGGFIGVDIFFVISGLLITGIISRELELGQFSLIGFYARRVRRIFPALIVVLIFVLILGWLWLLPEAYAQLSADIFASAAFHANIALLLQSGYFDVESAKKPLLHLWSLGIEEQFYLFWPLVLMLATRARLSLLAVASVLAVSSFVLNVALIGSDPVATFYLPFTRAWELLSGAALACGFHRVSQSERASNLRAGTGTVLITLAALALQSASAFPGWWAVLPVAGAALLLSAPAAWGCRHLLANPMMVWTGKISYPLYLWHWPLLVFFAIIKFAPLTLLERGLIVALSIILAWVTYRFVEIPLRFGRQSPMKVATLSGTMAIVALAGIIVVRNAGLDFRLPPQIRDMAHVPTQAAKWRVHECLLDLGHETTFADDCVDRGRGPMLLIWGDSTAGALMPGLRKAQEIDQFRIAQFTSSSCMPALNVEMAGLPNCRAINSKVLALARRLNPEIVLLHSTWDRYLDHVAETVVALKQQTGARVVILGSIPWWKRGLQNEVLRYFMLHHQLIPERSTRAEPNGSDAALRAKLTPLGAEFISAWDVLCDAQGCLTRIGERASDIVQSDQVHLTEKGSELLVRSIIDQVLGERAPRSSDASQ
jgi:peptidoglycan/LPS O-acetylase OafA/YrhL